MIGLEQARVKDRSYLSLNSLAEENIPVVYFGVADVLRLSSEMFYINLLENNTPHVT